MPSNTKKAVHRLFLLVSAGIILHGVSLYVITDGGINFTALKFFTILSNILVAISFVHRLVFYNSKGAARHYLSISALVAITVTSLVYNFVLVPLGGARLVFSYYANFVTHLLAMVLALCSYFVFEVKGAFGFRHLLAGMVFPMMYWVVFVSIGGIIDFHPYFFMNPAAIGWGMIFVWFGALLAVFALLGLVLVRLDRKMGAKAGAEAVDD